MIGGFLGAGYVVEASIGHIRELPPNAAAVPAKYKGESWARLGVDVDHDFEPLYVVSADRKQQVSKLKALVKDADELYLATDEDREGEAIAWHLVEELKPKIPVRRMVFHEITPAAIAAAVANPREIDEQLVEAQKTRQILDRLYGYEVSPVLWKKVLPRLSAGRVQSVATRMVVERERERMAFHSAELLGRRPPRSHPSAPKAGDPDTFTATLVSVDDMRLATGRDFDAATGRAPSTVLHLDEAGARGLAARLDGREFAVQGVEEKPYRRRPYAPFMTSTLQQEAGRKFRWSAQQVMRTAQRLYENGYITYMRTDSTTLSETALTAARAQARELYGDAYVPAEPRVYTRKVKNAQEAHEAIRPAGDSFRTPGEVANQLSSEEFRLYELIWQRTLASQMSDAVGTTVSVRIGGTSVVGRVGRVHHQRPHDHLPRFPARLRRGHRRQRAGRAEGRRREAAAAADPRRRPRPARVRRRRPLHLAAVALHRAVAGQGDGGARRRPAVDLRLDHADDPGPRLRLEEGRRARSRRGRRSR